MSNLSKQAIVVDIYIYSYVYAYIHMYTHMDVTIMNKEAINFKESKQEHMGCLEGRMGRGKYDIIIL